MSMIDPAIAELQDKVGGRYTLVIVTAKRARAITEGASPLVDATDTDKVVTVAINEIDQEKVGALRKDR